MIDHEGDAVTEYEVDPAPFLDHPDDVALVVTWRDDDGALHLHVTVSPSITREQMDALLGSGVKLIAKRNDWQLRADGRHEIWIRGNAF